MSFTIGQIFIAGFTLVNMVWVGRLAYLQSQGRGFVTVPGRGTLTKKERNKLFEQLTAAEVAALYRYNYQISIGCFAYIGFLGPWNLMRGNMYGLSQLIMDGLLWTFTALLTIALLRLYHKDKHKYRNR